MYKSFRYRMRIVGKEHIWMLNEFKEAAKETEKA